MKQTYMLYHYSRLNVTFVFSVVSRINVANPHIFKPIDVIKVKGKILLMCMKYSLVLHKIFYFVIGCQEAHGQLVESCMKWCLMDQTVGLGSFGKPSSDGLNKGFL